MAKYLLIESRDPFEGGDVVGDYELAANLAQAGNEVTLFLVQNGVLPARPCAFSERLSQLAQEKVEVLAEAFSLAERGIAEDGLVEGVKAAPLELAVDRLAEGNKAMWL